MPKPKFKVNDRVLIDNKRKGTVVQVKRCRDYFFMVRCDKTGKTQAYLPNELELIIEEESDR